MIMIWIGMVLIALLQLPPLVKKKQWKELMAFIVFWVIAGIYASLILGTFTGKVSIVNHTELLNRLFNIVYRKSGH